MKKRKFRLIRDGYGGIDWDATYRAFEEYVGGARRAEQLMRVYNASYPTGTAYDRLFGRGQSKEDVFRRRAEAYGFSKQEAEAFLLMQ